MKKSLEDHLEDCYELSKRTSEISRQLAFAGIAVVWIFKNPDTEPTIIKDGLILPLFLWVICLGIDLLQHFFGSLASYIFFHVKQYQFDKKEIDGKDIPAPYWMDFTATAFFILKTIANVWAYIELGKFLLPKIIA
jgi:hypothetical protein